MLTRNKLRILIGIIPLLFVLEVAWGQQDSIFLWPKENIPFAKELPTDKEAFEVRGKLVLEPCIFPYLPEKGKRNGISVVICPGGGYRGLAMSKEGFRMAQWFQERGFAAFVLKYRLPRDVFMEQKELVPMTDLRKAALIVKENAIKWGLDPEKIGFMGYSAGGHLASTGAVNTQALHTEVELPAFSPYFNILIYPVITMQDGVTHKGSRRNLIGENPSQEAKDKFSGELHVNENTAPTFLLHSSDDKGVPVENSLKFYKALIENNVPAEMHIYPMGGHGFGFAEKFKYLSSWTDRLNDWLQHNFVEKE